MIKLYQIRKDLNIIKMRKIYLRTLKRYGYSSIYIKIHLRDFLGIVYFLKNITSKEVVTSILVLCI